MTHSSTKPGDIVLLTPEFTADLLLAGSFMLVERVDSFGIHGNVRVPHHPDGYVQYVAQTEELELTGGHLELATVS